MAGGRKKQVKIGYTFFMILVFNVTNTFEMNVAGFVFFRSLTFCFQFINVVQTAMLLFE